MFKRRPGATTCPLLAAPKGVEQTPHPSPRIAGLESTRPPAATHQRGHGPTRVLQIGAVVCRPAGLMAGGCGVPEVVGYLLSSVRDLAPLRLREPRVETRGCFLSSLSGLNLYAALIPFSFLPNETQSGRAADLRANRPATHIRHLRCRSENADDVAETGCIPGVEDSNVAWGPWGTSTPSTVSTVSTRR